MAADAAADVRFEPLTSIVKMVTEIGSSAVVGAIVLITGLWALSRRRRIDAVALIAGAALSFVASRVAKAAFDRARPLDPFVDTVGAAFPSGHALYSVALVACATVLVRAGAGWAVRFAVVTVSVVAVVVVALTRVYLNAHFLTDVLAGIALGVAVWALVGIVALFAGSIRHNEARTP
jgi:undecaprenyl-diphosphatase